MTVVIDASVVVAALVDTGRDGTWAEQELRRGDLAAPHITPAEVANVLRKAQLAGLASSDASLAYRDLLDLSIVLLPFHPFAERVWELRENLTAYDAWYVAAAERLDAPLVTLDRRLAQAPGISCTVVQPPDERPRS
jgi:predicted nucleic acid-binding protein